MTRGGRSRPRSATQTKAQRANHAHEKTSHPTQCVCRQRPWAAPLPRILAPHTAAQSQPPNLTHHWQPRSLQQRGQRRTPRQALQHGGGGGRGARGTKKDTPPPTWRAKCRERQDRRCTTRAREQRTGNYSPTPIAKRAIFLEWSIAGDGTEETRGGVPDGPTPNSSRGGGRSDSLAVAVGTFQVTRASSGRRKLSAHEHCHEHRACFTTAAITGRTSGVPEQPRPQHQQRPPA